MCTVCSEKACPGNAGGACIVCTSADIPAVVKDATKLGRTILDWCNERLVEAQLKWRAKTAADKNAKEASNVEAPFGSSRIAFWNSPSLSGPPEALALEAQPPPFLLKQEPSAQVSAAEKSTKSSQWWADHMAVAMASA